MKALKNLLSGLITWRATHQAFPFAGARAFHSLCPECELDRHLNL